MKKTFWLLLAVLSIITASCSKDSYYHNMAIIYPSGGKILYADQDLDSVVLYTTDSYQASSSVAWLSIPTDRTAGKIENYYRYVWQVSIPVQLEANTTEKTRTALVAVHTFGSDDWKQTGTVTFYQLPWVDVYSPVPSYSYVEGIPTAASFLATDSATQVSDTLKFYVYDKWTLSDGSFVHPTAIMGEKGDNVIALMLDSNTTKGERHDTLTLVIRGIKTRIAFKQEAPKEL